MYEYFEEKLTREEITNAFGEVERIEITGKLQLKEAYCSCISDLMMDDNNDFNVMGTVRLNFLLKKAIMTWC